uniref:Uncharacterized protein n=1 Tax=Arundo donax TaxID=35708 RepID=A0A0A9C3A0_ARUDO
MSQVLMGMVKPPGLDTGHMGLGAARELLWMDLEEHFVQHYLPYARYSMAVACLLWGVGHHVPGTHAGDTQVAHHLGDVDLDLHGPDNGHHGPGVDRHHGHPVEASNHVHHHVVEFSHLAVNLVQKLPKPPQKFLQSCQGQFFSSSP